VLRNGNAVRYWGGGIITHRVKCAAAHNRVAQKTPLYGKIADVTGQGGRNIMSRYVPEKLGGVDQAAVAFEGEIREFVRRDTAFPRRQRSERDAAADSPAENLNTLIQRVAAASMEEIDRVILELQDVRDMLRSEGERVSRDISGYASLNHASMTAMKVIGDNLKQWRDAPVNKTGVRRTNR
jgi:hypothetical protein